LPAGGAGASGQSGSSLPASQSAEVVRPPRASAIVADETNATTARAAASLLMSFSDEPDCQHGVKSSIFDHFRGAIETSELIRRGNRYQRLNIWLISK
jgi:hypothetical protein